MSQRNVELVGGPLCGAVVYRRREKNLISIWDSRLKRHFLYFAPGGRRAVYVGERTYVADYTRSKYVHCQDDYRLDNTVRTYRAWCERNEVA